MTTRRQIAANRRNAGFSTGPTTDEGKEHSSLNALRHGMRARDAVLPEEDYAEFCRLLDSLEAEWQPSSPRELFLVQQMACAQWRLNRMVRIENGGFVWAVYRWNNNRDLEVPPDHYGRNTLALGAAFFKSCEGDPFSKLTRYENSLRRAYYNAMQTLEKSRAAGAGKLSRPNEPNSPLPAPPATPTAPPAAD